MTISSKEKAAENGAPGQHSGGDLRLRGSEVFVGGLQRNVTEGVIHEFFSNCGKVAEIRIMKDHSGLPKGYCFVRFTTRDAASRAQKEKDGTLLQGKKIGVTLSTDQDTLFLGNLRKEWGPEEVDQMVRQAFQDVQSVELAMPPSTGESPPSKKRQNRGFAFVHFASHAAAARAYRAASRPDFMLGGKWRPAVDWAENEPELDPDEMAKVKTAFVGNLPNNVQEEFLQTLFGPFGKVERVAISRKSNIPVGFVHFAQRSELDAAIEGLDGKAIDGPSKGPKFKLQVSLAKPADKARKRAREEIGGPGILASAPISQFAGAVGRYDSLVPAGAYGDYTDYVVAKNPRVENKQFSLPEVADPYELAVVSLRPAVADKLIQIFRQGLATRQEVDIRAVESLRDLPEQAAVSALEQFALSSFTDVRSKAAYLVGVINRTSKPHDEEKGEKAVLSSLSRSSSPNDKVRRELLDKPGIRDLHRRAVRVEDDGSVSHGRVSANFLDVEEVSSRAVACGRGGRSHVLARDLAFGSATRIPVFDPVNVPYAVDADVLGVDVYGNVGTRRALPVGNVLLHRMPNTIGNGYGLPSYRLQTATGHMGAAVVVPAMNDRRSFKFDPFTGEPYKFDPFTGEPLQTGARMRSKYY